MPTAVKGNSIVNWAGILFLKQELNSLLVLEASLTYLTTIMLPNPLFSLGVREHRNTVVELLTSPGIESQQERQVLSQIFRRFLGLNRIKATTAFLAVLPSLTPWL
jgi:hypothetical protein